MTSATHDEDNQERSKWDAEDQRVRMGSAGPLLKVNYERRVAALLAQLERVQASAGRLAACSKVAQENVWSALTASRLKIVYEELAGMVRRKESTNAKRAMGSIAKSYVDLPRDLCRATTNLLSRFSKDDQAMAINLLLAELMQQKRALDAQPKPDGAAPLPVTATVSTPSDTRSNITLADGTVLESNNEPSAEDRSGEGTTPFDPGYGRFVDLFSDLEHSIEAEAMLARQQATMARRYCEEARGSTASVSQNEAMRYLHSRLPRLGVSDAQLKNWRDQGRLESWKSLDGRVRISWPSLLSFIQEQEASPTTENMVDAARMSVQHGASPHRRGPKTQTKPYPLFPRSRPENPS